MVIPQVAPQTCMQDNVSKRREGGGRRLEGCSISCNSSAVVCKVCNRTNCSVLWNWERQDEIELAETCQTTRGAICRTSLPSRWIRSQKAIRSCRKEKLHRSTSGLLDEMPTVATTLPAVGRYVFPDPLASICMYCTRSANVVPCACL